MEYNIKYIIKRIKDELHASEDYMNKSVDESSSGNGSYAQMFYTLGIQELSHAETLMKMLEDNIKKWDTEHKDYSTDSNIYKSVFDSYYTELKEDYTKLKERVSKIK